jgi:hypothetical protein
VKTQRQGNLINEIIVVCGEREKGREREREKDLDIFVTGSIWGGGGGRRLDIPNVHSIEVSQL